MKKIAYFIVVFTYFFSSVAIATAQTAKQKVAIYVTGDVENGYKKVIGSKLVTGITRSEDYAAVERTADFLAELTKEQDYQMSGAVSDNQIARLGQQFGVRYVLVADISEVFESMFISARMIDVQTAQITNSTETNGVVSNMESLTKLAENIVLAIIGIPTFTENTVKLLGSYSSAKSLQECRVPAGYHIATKDEMLDVIKNYQMTGKKLSFPIYTDINYSTEYLTQNFTVKFYKYKGTNVVKTESKTRDYKKYLCTCTFIESSGKSSILSVSYIDDSDYTWEYSTWNAPGDTWHYKTATQGLINMSTIPPSITPGYVYIIKNKDK